MQPEEQRGPLSDTRLFILAALIGAGGMSLVVAQVLWFVPRAADLKFLLAVFLAVPFITLLILPVMPRQRHIDLKIRYGWRSPVAWIELGLPGALALISLAAIGFSGDFGHNWGLPMFLALVTGRNLSLLARCLLMEREARSTSGRQRRG